MDGMGLSPQEFNAMTKRARVSHEAHNELDMIFTALLHLYLPETFMITRELLDTWDAAKVAKLLRHEVVVPIEGCTEERGPYYFPQGVSKEKIAWLNKRGLVYFLYCLGRLIPGQEGTIGEMMNREYGYWHTFSKQENEAWRFCRRPIPRTQWYPLELLPVGETYEFPEAKFNELRQQQQLQLQPPQLHHHDHSGNTAHACAAAEEQKTEEKVELKAEQHDEKCVAGHALTAGTLVDGSHGSAASAGGDDEDADRHGKRRRIKGEQGLCGGFAKPECGGEETTAAASSSSSSATTTATTTTTTTTTTRKRTRSSNSSNGMGKVDITTTTIRGGSSSSSSGYRTRSTTKTPPAAASTNMGLLTTTNSTDTSHTHATSATHAIRHTTPSPTETRTHVQGMMDFLSSVLPVVGDFMGLVFMPVKHSASILIVHPTTATIQATFVRNWSGWRVELSTRVCWPQKLTEKTLEEWLNNCDPAAATDVALAVLIAVAIAAEAAPKVDESHFYTPCGGQQDDRDLENLFEPVDDSCSFDGVVTVDVL